MTQSLKFWQSFTLEQGKGGFEFTCFKIIQEAFDHSMCTTLNVTLKKACDYLEKDALTSKSSWSTEMRNTSVKSTFVT